MKKILLVLCMAASTSAFASNGVINLSKVSDDDAKSLYGIGNNSLVNIPENQFGLVAYNVTNSGTIPLVNVSFPILSGDFSYDNSRSTCQNINTSSQLAVNQSCVIVIKYQPTAYFGIINGNLPLVITGLALNGDTLGSVNSSVVDIPFSARAQ